MPERMTAKKVRIKDLANGEWVQQDGMEPSYVVSRNKERVSRARLLATVVSKFLSEDGNFGSITLDDGTDTIRAKAFKDLRLLEGTEPGRMVDVIGKVREYNGEIYVMPEVIRPVKDPNFILLRKAEIAKRLGEIAEEVKDKGEEGSAESKSQQESSTKEVKGTKDAEKEQLRKKVLEIIDKNKDGIEYAGLISESKSQEDRVDAVVNDLLAEGICYEPTPGKIKKI
jgi:RPA family protein